MDKLLSDLRVRLARRLPVKVMKAVRPFLTVQFVVFMAMGVLNTAISVTTATLLDVIHARYVTQDNFFGIFIRRTHLSFICGYIISIITSFFLNCRFTFHRRPTWDKFIKFPVIYIPNFLFQYIFVFIFTALGQSRTAAYICAAVIGTPLTFAAMKFLVFRRKRQ